MPSYVLFLNQPGRHFPLSLAFISSHLFSTSYFHCHVYSMCETMQIHLCETENVNKASCVSGRTIFLDFRTFSFPSEPFRADVQQMWCVSFFCFISLSLEDGCSS